MCMSTFSRDVHIQYTSGVGDASKCKHRVSTYMCLSVCVCVSVCLLPSVSTVWSLLGAKGQTVCHREVSGYDEAS